MYDIALKNDICLCFVTNNYLSLKAVSYNIYCRKIVLNRNMLRTNRLAAGKRIRSALSIRICCLGQAKRMRLSG